MFRPTPRSPFRLVTVKPAFMAAVSLGAGWAHLATAEPVTIDADDLAFFEAKIRPLLSENCYDCHSVGAKRIRGGFLLDSRPGLLRGGDSGPVITPGQADSSRLINMVRHHPDFEAMPPKSKLSDPQIQDLITWIDRGAHDPRLEEPKGPALVSDFDLEARKKWWSLQPIADPTPPTVEDSTWPTNAYDQFILAALESKGWTPAKPADRRTLLRRLSFDLTGLAPTPEELDAFLHDPAADAYAKQVDRLLASPHFGEKWARHWMDLVRYAETKAFEADYTMSFSYRYRDYLISAFNADVPFDQFTLEALAGDLLPTPRIDPVTGDNESVKGPGFLFLSDGQHGPPDLHEDEARIFSTVIDVTTKTFLASTVACARCHDHKFDAITTADYYSLYGILNSSRLSYTNAVVESDHRDTMSAVESAHARLEPLIFAALETEFTQAHAYLAARDALLADGTLPAEVAELRDTFPKKLKPHQEREYLDQLTALLDTHCTPAAGESLDPGVLQNWVRLALLPPEQSRWPELAPLFAALNPAPAPPASTTPVRSSPAFDALLPSLADWSRQGLAFTPRAVPSAGLVIAADGPDVVKTLLASDTFTTHPARRLSGVIRSPDFILDGHPIRFQAKGAFATIRLVIRNYELAGRGPTTSDLSVDLSGDHWQEISIPTSLWPGQPAYLEIVHHGQLTKAIMPKDTVADFDDNAYLALRFAPPDPRPAPADATELLNALPDLWHRAQTQSLTAAESDLLGAWIGAGLIQSDLARHPALAEPLAHYRRLLREIPAPRYVRSLVEGDPGDEPVYIRGNHKNLSVEPNPRHFLDGLDGPDFEPHGSGRLDWALAVIDPHNPLTSRVLVNRLWHHLFGQGLVTTVNDFGRMGTAPSHPELLDYLARDLLRERWSMKTLIRRMVLSRTYQMASTPSEVAQREDPTNRLWQHMPIRRLDAEAVRDHILASSGELDQTLHGPSVPAYVGDLPDSREKPPVSGPIDGDGRRSIYLEVRRNYLPSFLTAFDLPNATESVGERHTTNVPAQSLALLNDPFVHDQAQRWAEKTLALPGSDSDRINHLHLVAFSRPAAPTEIAWARDLLAAMAEAHQTGPHDVAPWADLCHLMINRKEFIYVQ